MTLTWFAIAALLAGFLCIGISILLPTNFLAGSFLFAFIAGTLIAFALEHLKELL